MRSGIGITIALGCIWAVAAPAAAHGAPTREPGPPRVTLAWLPRGTGVEQLGRVPGLAIGLLSAGLGGVPAAQTYLDIGQGNRIFDSLYDSDLPRPIRLRRDRVVPWAAVARRAASAPADIVPGLLASTLKSVGVSVAAPGSHSPSDLSVVDRKGALPGPYNSARDPNRTPSLIVRNAAIGDLRPMIGRLRGSDLLIAVERPPPPADRRLAIAIAGRGFDGELTSDSTRTDGYVLSTDLAPTILWRLGVGIPSQMSGEPIRSVGSVDAAALSSLDDRFAAIPVRRGPVIGVSVAVWLAVLVLVAAAGRRRWAATAVRMTALSVVYLPLALLATAALEPSLAAERAIVLLGCPALAAATLAAARGYAALAIACAATVLAYAIDMIAGSPLTSLSLIGPNPGLGVRFYGIGNELEATLAALVVGGTGAALTALRPRLAGRAAAAVFVAVGVVFAFIFASGRFGADVGAAIVMPVAAAVAAAALAAPNRRGVLAVAAVPLVAVALLALADLASGANAHLTRSVLDAGGFGDLADVAQRRLRLSARSFARPVVLVFLPLVAILAVLAWRHRRRLTAWIGPREAMRAGLAGVVAATVVGTLVNDSGALLLEIGTAYLLVFVGYLWAEGAIQPPAEAGDQAGRYP